MSFKHHATSFVAGLTAGLPGGAAAAFGDIPSAVVISAGASSGMLALFLKTNTPIKPRSAIAGACIGAIGALTTTYNMTSEYRTQNAAPEHTSTMIEQQKPSEVPTAGSTTYQSMSGSVVIPRGLKIG